LEKPLWAPCFLVPQQVAQPVRSQWETYNAVF